MLDQARDRARVHPLERVERGGARLRGDAGEHVVGAVGAQRAAHHAADMRVGAEADRGARPRALDEQVEHAVDLALGHVGDAEHRAAKLLHLFRIEPAEHVGGLLLGEQHQQDRGRLAAARGCRRVGIGHQRVSLRGIGADQVAHDERGARRILPHEVADQLGAGRVARRRPRSCRASPAADRRAPRRRSRRCHLLADRRRGLGDRLGLRGSGGGAALEQRAADAEHQQRRDQQRREIAREQADPRRLLPFARLDRRDIGELARGDRDHVAACLIEADRALDQLLELRRARPACACPSPDP